LPWQGLARGKTKARRNDPTGLGDCHHGLPYGVALFAGVHFLIGDSFADTTVDVFGIADIDATDVSHLFDGSSVEKPVEYTETAQLTDTDCMGLGDIFVFGAKHGIVLSWFGEGPENGSPGWGGITQRD
jgi:hypothetical protein